MPETPGKVEEVLIRPLEELLFKIGEGVAAAQKTLDLNSIATQTLIQNDPVLREYGLEATWYHFPQVEAELKMTLSLQREEVKKGPAVIRKYRVHAAPFNATYQNIFHTDVGGSSCIRVKIASIPPPVRSGT